MSKVKCLDKHGKVHLVDKSQCIFRRSVYGCFIKDGQVLMVREKIIGRWELPGGGVDKGESDEQALIREIKEETGLLVKKINKLLHQYRSYYFDLGTDEPWDTDRSFYEVEIEDGEVLGEGNNIDVTAARWVDIKELKSILVADADLKVIKLRA